MMMRNIFIVDDDDSVRTSLIYLLSLLPKTVIHCFTSGDSFLAAAERLEPGCLLLDLNMPGTSGIGVLEAVRAFTPRFSTVVLTGEGDVNTAVQAFKLSALDFLQKPCSHAQLFNTIEQAFYRQAASFQSMARREDAMTKIHSLSPREHDVLMGLLAGLANKAIAHALDISPRTVEIYRAKLMEKLNARSLPEALGIAFTAGLFPES